MTNSFGGKRIKTAKKKLSNNGIIKHLERFKKLTNLSLKLGWLEKDPFRDYKMKFEKFDRAYLNQREQIILRRYDSRVTLEVKDFFRKCRAIFIIILALGVIGVTLWWTMGS